MSRRGFRLFVCVYECVCLCGCLYVSEEIEVGLNNKVRTFKNRSLKNQLASRKQKSNFGLVNSNRKRKKKREQEREYDSPLVVGGS